MNNKTSIEKQTKQEAMDDVMVILEIMREIDDIDMLGRGIEFKAILLKRLEEEIGKI